MPKSLQDWLAWQETLHPSEIELGLDRIRTVWQRMFPDPFPCPVITVGGTNGKGSCVAMLDSILQAANYRTGVYTSPHILRYNERIKINGQEVTDDLLCEAFEKVDQAREDVSITYFEFGTLAALWLFVNASPDVVILEVGMGGRLDAVNLIDPDVALLVSIDIDHKDWLGEDRDQIGREKAGIFRAGKPAVLGDPEPPASVLQTAENLGVRLFRMGQDFGFQKQESGWEWWGPKGKRSGLPIPALRGDVQFSNAASVLMTLECLQGQLPVTRDNVRRGLLEVTLPGRFQVIPGEIPIILDVSHNPAATDRLIANLKQYSCSGKTLAVIAMLADKEVEQVAGKLVSEVDRWYAAGLQVNRGLDATTLVNRLKKGGVAQMMECNTVLNAFERARADARPGDRILVFGSFYTVAEVMKRLV